MPGPEEWRSRRRVARRGRRTESGLSARFTLLSDSAGQPGCLHSTGSMNPDAHTTLAARRAGPWPSCSPASGMLGPFSIDTYLPAFTGIAQSIGATPVEMQQTLSAYLFGFAVMNLFHGALSGQLRPPPGRARRAGASSRSRRSAARCRSTSARWCFFRALQGMSAGAGIVVSRAVIRDMFPPADAQRVMSQVTIYFGVAPAVAPMVGGFLFVHAGWHAIFWFLTGVGVVLFVANWRLLPETLHRSHRQPFNVRNLLRGYWQLGSEPALPDAGAGERHPVQRHVPLRAVGAGLPRRAPAAWRRRSSSGSSCCTIAGIMAGAWLSGAHGRHASSRSTRSATAS